MKHLLYSIIFILLFTSNIKAQSDTISLYELDSIQSIEILFGIDDWGQSLDSLYVNSNEYQIATVKINGEEFPFSGVRIAKSLAGSTRATKKSFEIKLNLISQSQNYQGVRELVLSQSLRDPSFVRDVLFADMANDYLYSPRANYASLEINGTFYGLMVNLECINRDYIERNFSKSDGTLLGASLGTNKEEKIRVGDCRINAFGSLQKEASPTCYFNDYELISDGGWDHLMELCNVLGNEAATYSELNDMLDLDQVLWYLALSNLTVSLKSYAGRQSGNYYLYRKENGQFVILPWASNLSFGSFKGADTKSDLSIKELERLEPFLHKDNVTKPLISAVMRHPEAVVKYKAFYLELYNKYLKSNWYQDRIDELRQMIRPIREKDENSYYNLDQFDASLKKVTGKVSKIPPLESFLDGRHKFLKSVDFLKIVPPDVSNITFKRRDEFSDDPVEDFTIYVETSNYVKRAHVVYELENGEMTGELPLYDNGQKPDAKANDGVFSGTINPGEFGDMNYYLKLENAQSTRYIPANYKFNVKKITLEELNQ